MKQRIITGIFLFIFVTPFIIFGGYYFAFFTLLLLSLGMYEFFDIKRKANLEKMPVYLLILQFIMGYLLIFDIQVIKDYGIDYTNNAIMANYLLNPLWVILTFLIPLTSSVFDKKVSIMDAFYAIATTMFLSLGLKGLIYLRSYGFDANINHGSLLIAFLFIVTCTTDIFAYFGGYTCTKIFKDKTHKLNVRISPKKTVEGTIIGTIFGVGLGFLYAMLVLDNILSYSWYLYLILAFALSIAGQIGDLILSANKRYFNIKDYSNILPGHGGILDRIDSLLVNSMVGALIISLIAIL